MAEKTGEDAVAQFEQLFRGANQSMRLEMGISVLFACKPLELRLLASIVEDLGAAMIQPCVIIIP